jgi:hypothetical protein
MRTMNQLGGDGDPARVGVALVKVETVRARYSSRHNKRPNSCALFVERHEQVRNVAPQPAPRHLARNQVALNDHGEGCLRGDARAGRHVSIVMNVRQNVSNLSPPRPIACDRDGA